MARAKSPASSQSSATIGFEAELRLTALIAIGCCHGSDAGNLN